VNNTERYLLAWIPMVAIALANGALRQATFGKVLSEKRAHQVSTLIGSALITVFIWALFHRWPLSSAWQASSVGLTWLILTVLFEFGFGRLIGRSWPEMLRDYNLGKGRMWGLFLCWLTIAPYVFFRFGPPR
jgi:hypothetical protein